MNETSIGYHIKVIAQTIIEMRRTNERFASLENEFHFLREQYAIQERRLRLEICALLIDVGEADFYENYGFDNSYNSTSAYTTNVTNLNNEYQKDILTATHLQPHLDNLIHSNGYGESISQNENSATNIIKEIKEMLIQLTIKGSVRERKNGLLELRIAGLPSIYGRNKSEIEKKLNERLRQKKRQSKNSTNKKETPLLSEFFYTEYLPYKTNQNRSESTIKNYHTSFKYIVDNQFDKHLTAYKPKEIEDFLYSLPKERTRQVVQGLLNNMFARALVLGLIKSNPCTMVDKMAHTQKRGTAFSFIEQTEFFNNLIQCNRLNYSQKCYFIFVYLTGTRLKEALGLQADDVDFKNKVLSIHGTKTQGSNRDVPLTPLVEQLLLSLNVKSGAYFPFKSAYIENLYKLIRNKHKLHDLRHTYGTIQICVEKVDIKTVSLVMGHSTVNTTLAIYTHPEQLDKGTFLRGDLTHEEKESIYKNKYQQILSQIKGFLK